MIEAETRGAEAVQTRLVPLQWGRLVIEAETRLQHAERGLLRFNGAAS